jgi:6,7-dimethyl-8-ribityllumazine synthase
MTISESQGVLKKLDQHFRTVEAQKRIRELESILVLSTLWYPTIISGLKKSSRDFFKSLEIPDEKLLYVDVPGALELPFAARMGASGRLQEQRTRPDCIVVLGCIQKGGTPHFDFVCQSAFEGLLDVQLQKKIPMGIGLLTVNTLEEAEARLGKGMEAAQAALFMAFSLGPVKQGRGSKET